VADILTQKYAPVRRQGGVANAAVLVFRKGLEMRMVCACSSQCNRNITLTGSTGPAGMTARDARAGRKNRSGSKLMPDNTREYIPPSE